MNTPLPLAPLIRPVIEPPPTPVSAPSRWNSAPTVPFMIPVVSPSPEFRMMPLSPPNDAAPETKSTSGVPDGSRHLFVPVVITPVLMISPRCNPATEIRILSAPVQISVPALVIVFVCAGLAALPPCTTLTGRVVIGPPAGTESAVPVPSPVTVTPLWIVTIAPPF